MAGTIVQMPGKLPSSCFPCTSWSGPISSCPSNWWCTPMKPACPDCSLLSCSCPGIHGRCLGKGPGASFQGHRLSVGHPDQRTDVSLSILPARSWLCYWQRRCKMAANPAEQLLCVVWESFLPLLLSLLQFNSNKREALPSLANWLERGDFECIDFSLPIQR